MRNFLDVCQIKKKTHLRKMHEKSNVVQKHFIQLTFVASNLSRPQPQAKILRLWTRGNRTYSCIDRKFSIDSLLSLPLFPKLSEFFVQYVDTTWPCKKKLKINAEIVFFLFKYFDLKETMKTTEGCTSNAFNTHRKLYVKRELCWFRETSIQNQTMIKRNNNSIF